MYPDQITILNGLVMTSVSKMVADRSIRFLKSSLSNIILDQAPEARLNPWIYATSANWSANNPVMNSIREMEQDIIKDVQRSPLLKKLLDQPRWGKSERQQWEAEVSRIVSSRVGSDDLMKEYRTLSESVSRTSDLSNLAQNSSFDCVTMSMVEGKLLQAVDDKLLKSKHASQSEENLRRPSQYYIAAGVMSYPDPENPKQLTGGSHAFVVSSLTGAVIEATAGATIRPQKAGAQGVFSTSNTPYHLSIDHHYEFADMIAGYSFRGAPVRQGLGGALEFVIPDGASAHAYTIYNVGHEGTAASTQRVEARLEMAKDKQFDGEALAPASPLLHDNWLRHTMMQRSFEGLRHHLLQHNTSEIHHAAQLKFRGALYDNPLSQAIMFAGSKDFSLEHIDSDNPNKSIVVADWLKDANALAQARETTNGWGNITVKVPEKPATAVAGWSAMTVTYPDGRTERIVTEPPAVSPRR